MGSRTWVAMVLAALVGPACAEVEVPEVRWRFTAAGAHGTEDPPETVAALELAGGDHEVPLACLSAGQVGWPETFGKATGRSCAELRRRATR